MRYYLDTNILIFVLFNEQGSIHHDVKVILEDYANSLFVSSVVVQEIILLFRIGKLNYKLTYKNEKDLIKKIEELNIQTVYFSKENDLTYFGLKIAENHKDMNDHLIISQAISDKIPVISSDNKFREYIEQGLNFIFNRR
jgi:PIN domain nuclease of toxin-antitoxin system